MTLRTTSALDAALRWCFKSSSVRSVFSSKFNVVSGIGNRPRRTLFGFYIYVARHPVIPPEWLVAICGSSLEANYVAAVPDASLAREHNARSIMRSSPVGLPSAPPHNRRYVLVLAPCHHQQPSQPHVSCPASKSGLPAA